MRKLLVVWGLILIVVLSGCRKEDAFVVGENDIIINTGTEWELPGILTLPEGKGPFPVAIFVQASVPEDRYLGESLIECLVKQGIAGILYEQRIFTYPQITQDVNYTLKEGSVDDMLSAAALAKTIKRINPDMIFVIGYSQNGFLIPKIYEEDTESTIAGFISMAGPAQPMMHENKERIEKLLSNTEISEGEINMYKTILGLFDEIENLTEADLGKDQMLFGHYPSHWLYLADYDPAESAKSMDKPVLFLHGSSDRDVSPDDLDIWKVATQKNPKAAYKLYPGLNHDFGFYYTYAEVDEEVIIDIANFIKNRYK